MTTATLAWRVPGFAAMARFDYIEPPIALAPTEFESIQRREPEAWNSLFDREMPAIYRYALTRLGDPAQAEDATSEVFEAAWKSAESVEDRGLPLRAWLFGIARNVVAGHRRSWFKAPPQVALETFDAPVSDARLAPEALDLARAIAALDGTHAEVINLRFIQGLSLQDVASVLGVSVDAVKGRQARALAVLREKVGPA